MDHTRGSCSSYKRQLQYLYQLQATVLAVYVHISYQLAIMEPAKIKRDKINTKRKEKRSSEKEEQRLARLAKLREKRSSETEEQKLARRAKRNERDRARRARKGAEVAALHAKEHQAPALYLLEVSPEMQ